MTDSSPCLDLMHELWNAHLSDFSEVPVLLFESANCVGPQWPRAGEAPLWDQTVSLESTGLNTIGSFIVPPHAVLKLRSAKHGQVELGGVVSDTSAMIMQIWQTETGEPCPQTLSHDCGQRIDWTALDRFRIHRQKPWLKYLHDKAVQSSINESYTVRLHGKTYQPDFDALMTDLCASKDIAGVNCTCHDEFLQLQADHPEVPLSKLRLGSFNSSCNPLHHYVPTKAARSEGTVLECLDTLHAMITAGSHAFGDNNVLCGRQLFTNQANEEDNETALRESNLGTLMNWTWLVIVLALTAWMALVVWIQVRSHVALHPLGSTPK